MFFRYNPLGQLYNHYIHTWTLLISPVSQLAPLLLFFIWNFHFLLPTTGLCIICFLCLGHFFLSSLPYKLLFLMAQYHNVRKASGDYCKSMLLPVMCSQCPLHLSFTALWWLQIIYVIFWLMGSPYWTMSWIKIGVVSTSLTWHSVLHIC